MRWLKNIQNRHRVSVMYALWYEFFIRIYKVKPVRKVLMHLFKKKEPKNIVFVVGCYNSGTTIIKDAIAAHPGISSAPIEGDQLTDVIDDNEFGIAPRAMMVNICDVVKDRRVGAVDRNMFLSQLRPWIKTGKVFLEKSISNTVRINKLRSAFPGSKYICVTRDIDKVSSGIKKRSRPTGILRQILGQDSYPDTMLVRQWQMFYSLVLRDYDSEDIHFVSYEKFLLSPVDELNKIIDFIGLDAVELTFTSNTLSVGNKSFHIRGGDNVHDMNFLDSYSELQSAVDRIKQIA